MSFRSRFFFLFFIDLFFLPFAFAFAFGIENEFKCTTTGLFGLADVDLGVVLFCLLWPILPSPPPLSDSHSLSTFPIYSMDLALVTTGYDKHATRVCFLHTHIMDNRLS